MVISSDSVFFGGLQTEFLGVPLTPAKRAAIIEAVSFSAMKTNDQKRGLMLRKGVIGDWRNHFDLESWTRVDAVFDEICGDLSIAQPLKKYQ